MRSSACDSRSPSEARSHTVSPEEGAAGARPRPPTLDSTPSLPPPTIPPRAPPPTRTPRAEDARRVTPSAVSWGAAPPGDEPTTPSPERTGGRLIATNPRLSRTSYYRQCMFASQDRGPTGETRSTVSPEPPDRGGDPGETTRPRQSPSPRRGGREVMSRPREARATCWSAPSWRQGVRARDSF
jgi:hypothetical protein